MQNFHLFCTLNLKNTNQSKKKTVETSLSNVSASSKRTKMNWMRIAALMQGVCKKKIKIPYKQNLSLLARLKWVICNSILLDVPLNVKHHYIICYLRIHIPVYFYFQVWRGKNKRRIPGRLEFSNGHTESISCILWIQDRPWIPQLHNHINSSFRTILIQHGLRFSSLAVYDPLFKK